MIDKLISELIAEVKKIRNDLDAVKAYTKTMAEQITIIAENTAPATPETPAENAES